MRSLSSFRWIIFAVSAVLLMITAVACGSAEQPAPPTPIPVDVAAIVQQAMEAQQPGVTADDMAGAIQSALSAQPGVTTQDVASEISKALRAQPGGVTSQEMAAAVSNALAEQPGGVTSDEMASAIANALAEQPGVTTQDVAMEITKALKAQPGGVTSQEMASAISSALSAQPGVTTGDVAAEIAKALAAQPGGITSQEMASAISSALSAQPGGVTSEEMASAISGALAAQPGITSQDVAMEISKALSAQPGGVTSEDMAAAISNALAAQPGVTTQDIADEIAKALAAQPGGINEEQMAMAIESALKAQGVTQMEIQSAVETAVESAVQMAVAAAIPTAAPMMDDMMDDMVNPGTVTVMSTTFGGERFSQRGSSPTDYERQFHGYLIDSDVVDGRMIIVPGLARRWELSSDGKTTKYTIREGAKFHDGAYIETEDALWSLQNSMGPEAFEYGVGAGLRYAQNMRSISITGPNEISVVSNVSIPEMHRYTSRGSGTASVSAVFPRRPNLYDEAGELAYDLNPIGAGPIRLREHSLGESMTFERFGDYYHQPANGFFQDQTLQFQTLRLVLAPDESTRVAALRANEVDMARVTLQQKDQIEAGGGQLVWSAEARAFMIMPEGCHDEMIACSDKRVRHALQYAIDKETMQNQLWGGPEVMQIKGWFMVTTSTIGYSEDLDPFPYNAMKAQQLLAEAGYPNGEGFPKLTINTYISPFIPFMVESAQLAADSISETLGIEVEVKQHDKSAIGRARHFMPSDYKGQLYWGGNDGRMSAVGIVGGSYSNSGIATNPAFGTYLHNNQELRDHYDRIRATVGRDGEHAAWNEYYKILKEESYHLGLGYLNLSWGLGPRIETWQPHPLSQHATAFHTIVLKDDDM